MLVTERQAVDSEANGLPPLRIEFIKQGEAAARAGFQAWDLFESVGGQRFTSIEALRDWLKDRRSGERVPVLVRRHVASFDRRIGAEYHRFEIAPSDLRLMTAGE
jgi:S1-C subfamily serine protease